MIDTVRAPGRNVFFALAALAVLMASIDATIVAVAIPQLTAALNAPLTWVSWTLTGYQLVQVIMLPLAGQLSDTLGRKRVFLACVATFTAGSLLSGLAPSIGVLILCRLLQAMGGGGLMPSAIGIISDQFKERRAQAIGLFTSVFPLGGIIGPNLGGFIVQHWSWRELFFINVPIGVLVFIGVRQLLSETGPSTRRPAIDWAGLVLFAVAIVALLSDMTALGNAPSFWQSPWFWVLLLVSAASLVLLLRHLRVAANPLVDFELIAGQPFLAANLYNLLFGAAAFGFFSFVPYYAVVRYGLTPFESGAVLTPRALMMIGATTVASLYVIKLGYHVPMLTGMGLVALSLVLLSFGWTSLDLGPLHVSGFWLLAMIVSLSGLGMGFAAPASNNAALDLAPRRAAQLTGLRGMFRQTGGAIGIAAIVLVLSLVPDQAQGLSTVFAVLAGVLLLTVPLTLMIPDTARQRYLGRRAGESGPMEPPLEITPRRQPGG